MRRKTDDERRDDTPTFVQPTLWVFSFSHTKVHESIKIHKQQVQPLAIPCISTNVTIVFPMAWYTCWMGHFNASHWNAGLFTGTVRGSGSHHRSTLTNSYSNTDGAPSGSKLTRTRTKPTRNQTDLEQHNLRPIRTAADQIWKAKRRI
jgi:hypothetical protein